MTEPVMILEDIGVDYPKYRSWFRRGKQVALDALSFHIKHGETLGIIGANGCGKSTLLRVLAGIYKPSRGTIVSKEVSVSLLALSVGFDALLSGRHNAIIGGMFLGATRREVQAKIDDIIEFSGLGARIDDQILTYSTGMRARLAFSVDLEMRADLLLIDEVLGVGDASFRSKAESAMISKIASDQTVVFVSHSMAQVSRLCDRVVWLHRGGIRKIGTPAQVVDTYTDFMNSTDESLEP